MRYDGRNLQPSAATNATALITQSGSGLPDITVLPLMHQNQPQTSLSMAHSWHTQSQRGTVPAHRNRGGSESPPEPEYALLGPWIHRHLDVS